MIPASRLVIDFDRRFDRFLSQDNQRLRLEDKLAVINEAIEIYFENKVKIAETNSSVRNILRSLEEKEVSLKNLRDEKHYTIFEIPEKSYTILRQRALVSKEHCGTKEIPVLMFQSDDINNARKSPYWKSSYQWEHAIADEGAKGLYVWHEGDFKIDELIVDYYRRPQEVHAPSMKEEKFYIDWNGKKQTKDQGLELRDYAYKDIGDIASLIYKANIGDASDYEIQLSKILNVENIQ